MSSGNELRYPITELKKVVHKHLYLEDDRIIDIILAVHIANRFDADPIWMILIASPSGGKTETLGALDGHQDIYFLSTLTPSTFISGKNTGKGKPPASLLPKIDGKTLVFKDFTTILSMRSEHQVEILAQLREIYDGHFTKAFGTGAVFDWKGKIGFIAACTPIYDKHYGVIGSMGDRFLLYRSPKLNGERMGFAAQKNVGKESIMRSELKEAYHHFLDQFNDLENISFDHDETVNHQIIFLACFCAVARCPVDRNYRGDTIDYDPEPEGPARLVKQLTQIGMGLALVAGKNIIDLEVYETVKKIGRDLVSATRLRIFACLYDERANEQTGLWMTTKEIADYVNKPTKTTKRYLEDLMVVGALNRKRRDETQNAPYEWQVKNQTYDWITKAEVFEDSI
jgi:hypothetical protein